jgi:prophage regulatory protein
MRWWRAAATIRHLKPFVGVRRNGFRGCMPRPLPRLPHVQSPLLSRAELLSTVPLSQSTIDRLESQGQFPKRIRLPTNRVAWLRREVMAYLRQLATRSRPPVPTLRSCAPRSATAATGKITAVSKGGKS